MNKKHHFNHIIVCIIKKIEIQKNIWIGKRWNHVFARCFGKKAMVAFYSQRRSSMKKITCEADIEKLPQPMSKEFFEKCKQAILEKAELGIISRVQLCKMFFFLKRNTLRNLDSSNSLKEGIRNPQHIGSRKYVYYHVEDVLEYLEREFCIKPQERIDDAKKELEKYQAEQQRQKELQEKRTTNYYRTGETK